MRNILEGHTIGALERANMTRLRLRQFCLLGSGVVAAAAVTQLQKVGGYFDAFSFG